MAAGYDGSVHVDSRIDTKGFNDGIKRMRLGMKSTLLAIAVDVMRVSVVVAKVVEAVIRVVMAMGVALVGVAAAVVLLGIRLFKMLSDSISQTSAYYSMVEQLKGGFNNLKGAFLGAFGTLLHAALPAILTVINWLTRLINLTAQFIAMLTGQKTYMKYIEGSAEATAKATGTAAKNTEKQAKAAKGALAAFDEINVLQTETADETADLGDVGGGGAAGGGPMQFEAAPVEAEVGAFAGRITEIWEGIKNKFNEIWQSIMDFLEPLREPLKELEDAFKRWGSAVWDALKPVWDWLVETGKSLVGESLEGWRKLAIDGIEFLTEKINELAKWVEENPEKFRKWAIAALLVVAALALILVPGLAVIALIAGLILIIGLLAARFNSIPEILNEALRSAMMLLAIFGAWILINIINPIKEAFRDVLDWIGEKWEKIFTNVKNFTKKTINTIIDFMNGMIRAVASGLNAVIGGLNSIRVTIPSWIPKIGGNSWGLSISTVDAPQIPRLATGAVIPPNAEFAAILGDQKSGRNIEAPEGLIRQIMQEELGNIKADVSIGFSGSLSALVRELKPYIDKENVRIGKSLVGSKI